MHLRLHTTLRVALLCLATLFCSCANGGKEKEDTTLLMLRFRGTATYTDQVWDSTFGMIKDNPGCCDEVWFSTGLGFPSPDIHRQRAAIITRGMRELRSIGVGSSLQVQMTIGHGDHLAKGEEQLYSELKWTRWTGSTGVVNEYCSCPRDPEFLKYMRQMAHIYAETHPRSVWIDDDLRYNNHKPATNGSHIGCWCDKCIEDFNAATDGKWTAKSLVKALDEGKNEDLVKSWEEFCISSLNDIARVIGEEFIKVSPKTRLGLQGGWKTGARERMQTSILKTLHQVGGQPVGYRPGGSSYYDEVNADGQIIKSMNCAAFRKSMGDPDWIVEWSAEVESWPRVYGSRTPQGVLVEGFSALAYGMNAVSMFILAAEKESPEVYSQTMLRPLATGSPMLRAYAKAIEGTVPVGYTAQEDNSKLYSFGRTAIPVLPGCGKDLGLLESADLSRVNLAKDVSDKVQDLREDLDARSACPVVCCSPFIGLVIPRIDENGILRTIALQNVRIDAQGPVKLRLRNLPEGANKAEWFEMKKEPVILRICEENGSRFVVIPRIDAWNCGFLSF